MYTGYCRTLLLSAAAVLVACWTYVLAVPLGFMDASYTSIVAKSSIASSCAPADVAFFGDSRVEAGIVSSLFNRAVNYGVAQGTAIEVQTLLRKVLACPNPPARVVISIAPHGFEALKPAFWTSSLGYGLLSASDLIRIERLASDLDDRVSLTAARTPDALTGPVRDWLYLSRFPTLYFGPLIAGRLTGRLTQNKEQLDRTLRANGFVPRSPHGRWTVQPEPPARQFIPSPLEIASFNDLLSELDAHGVEVSLINMPVRADTLDYMEPTYVAGFFSFLNGTARSHSSIRYVSDRFPVWPSDRFADNSHLDPEGAAAFTRQIARCGTDASCDGFVAISPMTDAALSNAPSNIQKSASSCSIGADCEKSAGNSTERDTSYADDPNSGRTNAGDRI